MDFFLRFTLISYAAIVFFAVGLRSALLTRLDLNLLRLGVIFLCVAVPLSLIFVHRPLVDRLCISAVWVSALSIGFRFGRKIVPK